MPAKVLLPKQLAVNARAMARAVANGLDAAARGALVDYKVTTQTWSAKPDFVVDAPNAAERVVGTNNKRYGWINDGTAARTIYPRRARRLRFMSGFRPKTTPGTIGSDRGYRGGAVVYARRVRHPGIKARNFDEAIAQKWRGLFPNIMQRAIDSEVS